MPSRLAGVLLVSSVLAIGFALLFLHESTWLRDIRRAQFVQSFELGYHGFDVSASDFADEVTPYLNADPRFVADGEYSLGVQIAHPFAAPTQVGVRGDTGCTPIQFESMSARVYVGPASLPATLRLFVESGRGVHSETATVVAQHGWNHLEGYQPSANGASLFSRPIDPSRVCGAGVIIAMDHPVHERIFIDEVVLYASELAQAASPRPSRPLLVQAEIPQWQESPTPISSMILGIDLQHDIALDTQILSGMQKSAPGRARVRLYPTLGADTRYLNPGRGGYRSSRLEQTVAAVQSAGWESVVTLGTEPSPMGPAQSSEDWVQLAAQVARALAHANVGLFEIDPYEETLNRHLSPAVSLRMAEAVATAEPSSAVQVDVPEDGPRTASMLDEWPSGPKWLAFDHRVEIDPAALLDPTVTVRRFQHRTILLQQALSRLSTRLSATIVPPESTPTEGWLARWAAFYASAATGGLETLYYPTGASGEPFPHMLQLFDMLTNGAGLPMSYWVHLRADQPWLIGLALRRPWEWNRQILLINLHGAAMDLDLHLPATPVAEVRGEVLRRARRVELEIPAWSMHPDRMDLSIHLEPWDVAVLTLEALTAPVSHPVDAQPQVRDGPIRFWPSYIGSSAETWTSYATQLFVAPDMDSKESAKVGPNDIVVFQSSTPDRQDSIGLRFGFSGRDDWLFFSIPLRPTGEPVSLHGARYLRFDVRSDTAIPPLTAALEMESCDSPTEVDISRYTASPTPDAWQRVQVPIRALVDPACHRARAIAFKVDGQRVPAARVTTLWLDSIVLVP